jgi:hypothetical protein
MLPRHLAGLLDFGHPSAKRWHPRVFPAVGGGPKVAVVPKGRTPEERLKSVPGMKMRAIMVSWRKVAMPGIS